MQPVRSPNWSPVEEFKSSPEAIKQHSREWVFTSDDTQLYEKIAQTLRDCFQRLEISEVPTLYDKAKGCHIIFRQSKSWSKVASLIDNITSSQSGKMNKIEMDVLKWKATWKRHIISLKSLEDQRINAEKSLRKNNHDHDACSTEVQRIVQAHASTRKKLNELSKELDETCDTIKSHPSCKPVIDYIQSNWHHLTVFVNWREVKINDDKIHVRIIPYTDTNDSGSTLIDKSTKAFFNVQPANQKEILVEYPGKETPSKAIIATKLDLIKKELAPPSPYSYLKKNNPPASPQSLPKALIYDLDFPNNSTVKVNTFDALAQNSFTALKLEILVNAALRTVNQELDPSSSTEEEPSESPTNKPPRRWLFKFLPH